VNISCFVVLLAIRSVPVEQVAKLLPLLLCNGTRSTLTDRLPSVYTLVVTSTFSQLVFMFLAFIKMSVTVRLNV
jgi:hypothetical protein